MADLIKKASNELRREELDRRNEIASCFKAVEKQLIGGAETLRSYGVSWRSATEDGCLLLRLQQGEDYDPDFSDLVAGFDADGWLIGEWDGVRYLPSGEVAVDSAAGRELMDSFPAAVARKFKIKS
jgi:hypothetical protein